MLPFVYGRKSYHFNARQDKNVKAQGTWVLDFKQQHFHILAGIYRYSGWNIQIFWMEYTDILTGIYLYPGWNISIFWLEYISILAGKYPYSGWNIQPTWASYFLSDSTALIAIASNNRYKFHFLFFPPNPKIVSYFVLSLKPLSLHYGLSP